MRWDSAATWLVDLGPFLPYWKAEAHAQRLPVLSLWKRIIAQQLFGYSREQIQTPLALEQLPICAVWDPSPLRAAMILSHMKHTHTTGWIIPGSVRATQLWNSLTWESWETTLDQLILNWDVTRPKGFTALRVRHLMKRLRATAERLALRPSQLNSLPLEGIQRRYGPWIARLCDWLNASATLDITYFPWKSWQLGIPIQVSRHLDNPTRKWAECTLELIEDLDTIARKTPQKTTELSWIIQFETHDTVTLPIRFRTPHFLRNELGHHRITLIQLTGAFSAFSATLTRCPFITGWTFIINGTLTTDIDRLTLFEFSMDAEHERQLDALANQVLTPLTRYQWEPHWAPELGFKDTQTPAHKELPHLGKLLPHAGPKRPLFTLTRPYGISLPKNSPQIESTMNAWWQGGNTQTAETRYHRYQDSQKRWLWVARTENKTEARGIYG
jgi:hypothetical protein